MVVAFIVFGFVTFVAGLNAHKIKGKYPKLDKVLAKLGAPE